MGFTGLRYLEYNCNGVDFMESIEMIFNMKEIIQKLKIKSFIKRKELKK